MPPETETKPAEPEAPAENATPEPAPPPASDEVKKHAASVLSKKAGVGKISADEILAAREDGEMTIVVTSTGHKFAIVDGDVEHLAGPGVLEAKRAAESADAASNGDPAFEARVAAAVRSLVASGQLDDLND